MKGRLFRVFVYGTLKAGFHNHHLLKGKIGQLAIMPGIELHEGPGFPYAVKGNGIVKGEVYEVDTQTLERLDILEGHPHHYCRKIFPVDIDDKRTVAWVYLSSEAWKYPKINNGEWLNQA